MKLQYRSQLDCFVALLLDLQGGYTKYCYFVVCLWYLRAKQYYKKKDWLVREEHSPGKVNIMHKCRLTPQKIVLPTLHIQAKLKDGVFENSLFLACAPVNLNIIHKCLILPQKIVLPPPHVKLRLVKKLVKALENTRATFKHLCSIFS